MAISQNTTTGKWEVSVCRRHPLTKKPVSKMRVGILTKTKAIQTEKIMFESLGQDFQKLIVPEWDKCVDEFIDDFSKRGISPKSVETYKLCLKKYTSKLWGGRLVTDICEYDVRQFVDSLQGSVSPSHQKNMLKYIKAVMDYACSKKYISHSATPRMRFKLGDKLKEGFSESQMTLLLSKAKEVGSEWYEVWATAMYTGMRNSELYALTWDNVDFENKRIKVNCSWTSKRGFRPSTKSEDDRWVEIAQDLAIILKELKGKNQNPPFVLPRIDAWDKGEQARVLRMFLEGVGLPRIRFHDLRASAATNMLSKGVEPIKVMKVFGWKELKTMQHYVRKSAVEICGTTKNISFMADTDK